MTGQEAQFGYASIYGQLSEFDMKSTQTPWVPSFPSERPWETIFTGSSHNLPPLTKLCSTFLESLLEKRTADAEWLEMVSDIYRCFLRGPFSLMIDVCSMCHLFFLIKRMCAHSFSSNITNGGIRLVDSVRCSNWVQSEAWGQYQRAIRTEFIPHFGFEILYLE